MGKEEFNTRPYAHILADGTITKNPEAPDIFPGIEPLFTRGYLAEQQRQLLSHVFAQLSIRVIGTLHATKSEAMADIEAFAAPLKKF